MIYVICNNDDLMSATFCKETAEEEVRKLKSSQIDRRCYFHFHEVKLLDDSLSEFTASDVMRLMKMLGVTSVVKLEAWESMNLHTRCLLLRDVLDVSGYLMNEEKNPT